MTDTLLSPLDRRKTLSIAEVAEALGLDTETVRRDARSGAIPGGFQRKPGGQWRFRRSILEEWWAKQGLSRGGKRL
jgi:excisionase family DNA binding protein